MLVAAGIEEVDAVALAAALSTKQLFAERQHRDLLAALNLDPRGLTLAYRLPQMH